MMTTEKNRFASFALLLFTSLSLCSARAQQLTKLQKIEVANCALHGGGGWVEHEWYDRGKVRFSSVLELDLDDAEKKDPDEKNPHDIYLAFWNSTRSAGELLVFLSFENSLGKKFLILNNQAHIVNKHGRLDIYDNLGGIWTHRKLQSLLPILRRKPVTVLTANRAQAGSSICQTPLGP